jgi:hypothetical protein
MLIVVPVVKVGDREIGRGLHGYVEDSGSGCHGCGCAAVSGGTNVAEETQGSGSRSIKCTVCFSWRGGERYRIGSKEAIGLCEGKGREEKYTTVPKFPLLSVEPVYHCRASATCCKYLVDPHNIDEA